jgi:hypothetical protein
MVDHKRVLSRWGLPLGVGPLLLIMCGYEVVGRCVDVGLVTCGPYNLCASHVSHLEKSYIASNGGE